MPAETQTNTEERLRKASEKLRQMPPITTPVHRSRKLVTEGDSEIASQFYPKRSLIKEMKLMLQGVTGEALGVEITSRDKLSVQTNYFEVSEGLNELPGEIRIPANSIVKVSLQSDSYFTVEEVYFTCEYINY